MLMYFVKSNFSLQHIGICAGICKPNKSHSAELFEIKLHTFKLFQLALHIVHNGWPAEKPFTCKFEHK